MGNELTVRSLGKVVPYAAAGFDVSNTSKREGVPRLTTLLFGIMIALM